MPHVRWISLGMVVAMGVSFASAMVTPLTACAQDSAAAAKPKVRKGSSSLITESEIANAGSGVSDAYEVIEKVRPTMLRSRVPTGGDATSGGIVVFLDEVRSGNVASLRNISSGQIKEIRYLKGPDATLRWGTGFPDGVIQVISKK